MPDAAAPATPREPAPSRRPPGLVEVEDLIVAYKDNIVIKRLSLSFKPGTVTAIIGPSGCGKTTLLRCLNRLSDVTDGCSVQGSIRLDGSDIFRTDPVLLRRRIGMVFQRPNPFPMSIRDNVVYGVRAHNDYRGSLLTLTQQSLERSAVALIGGQHDLYQLVAYIHEHNAAVGVVRPAFHGVASRALKAIPRSRLRSGG